MNKDAFHILSDIYPEDINFLDEKDDFRFLSSVLLSAQTTDKRVNEVTPLLFAEYDTVKKLAAADIFQLEEILHPLGFYRAKAKNLKALAAKIDELGFIPDTIDELVKLPGVGRKTANCYIGHILGRGAVIVDTHFARVAGRLGYTASTDPAKIEDDIRKEFDEDELFRLSMVLNLHGRKYCHARKPECEICPVRDYCRRQ